MEVKEWIAYADHEKYPDCGVGGMGGIAQPLSWAEYTDAYSPLGLEYLEALRAALSKRGRLTGDEHQNADDGVPLFSDGTVATYSFRGWGDLLAAIYNEKLGEKKYTYMDFYYYGWPEELT